MRWPLVVLCGAALVGCTNLGSPSAVPVRYSALTASNGYRTIFRFSDLKGTAPGAGLVELGGELYGTTSSGGKYGSGTVYKISPSGTEKVIHSFRSGFGDGIDPLYGSLTLVKGVFYGTTEYGGAHTAGTVYSITPSGNEKVVYSFKGGKDGANPWGGLVAINSVLYGTTYAGGPKNRGTVFSVTTNGNNERMLHAFAGGKDGANPTAGLTRVGIKGLFGTTEIGGAANLGTVFEVSGSTAHVFYSFRGGSANDGANPTSALTYANGTLYGMTDNGGAGGGKTPYGTVFSLSLTGHEKVLYTFLNSPDGANPSYGALTYFNGALFGVTRQGGTPGQGTIFKMTPSGAETQLYAFLGEADGGDGLLPYGAPVEFGGTLYGTTFEGGNAQQNGTAYRILP